MEYSITAAAKATGRSADSIRRAIRTGKLEATKDLATGYRITATALEAWLGQSLEAKSDQGRDLDAMTNELDTARREIAHQAQILEIQSEALTLARQSLEKAQEGNQGLAIALAAVTRQLEALPAGRPRRSWFRRSTRTDRDRTP